MNKIVTSLPVERGYSKLQLAENYMQLGQVNSRLTTIHCATAVASIRDKNSIMAWESQAHPEYPDHFQFPNVLSRTRALFRSAGDLGCGLITEENICGKFTNKKKNDGDIIL